MGKKVDATRVAKPRFYGNVHMIARKSGAHAKTDKAMRRKTRVLMRTGRYNEVSGSSIHEHLPTRVLMDGPEVRSLPMC